jgi:phosphoribosyl 1,2-cyclic phosphodiesterase
VKIISLGSGSKGNCMYLNVNGRNFLIDVGMSMKKINLHLLMSVGIDLEDIDGMFITHSHSDHTKSVKPLTTRYGIKAYMTKDVYEDIVNNRKTVLDSDKLGIIKSRGVTGGKKVDVEVVKLNHDVPTYAYIFTDKSTKETYLHLSDNGGIKRKDYIEKFKGMTYYAIESNYDHYMELFHETRPLLTKRRTIGYYGHTENSEAISFMVRVVTPSTRGVIFTHLSTQCNTPELAKETHQKMLQVFGNIRKVRHVRMAYALQDDIVGLV